MSDKTMGILIQVGVSLVLLAIGWLIIRAIASAVRRVLKHSRVDEALHLFIIRLLKIVLWLMLILTILGTAGVETHSFVAIIGAVGVAIAFALRETLGHFAGGILLLINKPFRRGDYIESTDAAGQVVDIDLMYTTLKTYDNRVLTVPNGKLSNQTVVNFTHEPRRRIDLSFSIAPGKSSDLERAKEILFRLIVEENRIKEEPAPVVLVAGQKEGYTILEMRVWCSTNDYWEIRYAMEEKIAVSLREDQIVLQRPVAEALHAGIRTFE